MRPSPLLALAVCLLSVAPLAHADEASRHAKAEQMMALTHSDAAMKEQLAALQDRISTLAHQQVPASPTPEQKTASEDYLKKVQSISNDEVGWDKLRPLVVQSYAESFTDEELDAILAFYKSPAGQAVVNKTPELSHKTVSLVEDRIKELQPKLATVTQEYAAKMKPAGTAPTLQPRTTPPPATPAAK